MRINDKFKKKYILKYVFIYIIGFLKTIYFKKMEFTIINLIIIEYIITVKFSAIFIKGKKVLKKNR